MDLGLYPGVCNQDVTAYFTEASAANRLPARAHWRLFWLRLTLYNAPPKSTRLRPHIHFCEIYLPRSFTIGKTTTRLRGGKCKVPGNMRVYGRVEI
jgi:hypothetical protein